MYGVFHRVAGQEFSAARMAGWFSDASPEVLDVLADRDPWADASAREIVGLLLRLFEIVPVDEDRLLQALDLDLPDFEDAVQAACAEKAGVDALVTRNEPEFEGAER